MKHILLFAEDPGAFNYIAPILTSLGKKHRLSLVCDGIARTKATARGLPLISWDEKEAVTVFLARIQPDCILVGTAENKSTRGFALLKEAKVPTVGYIDANMNAAARFSGGTENPLANAPNFLFVPDNFLRTDFIQLGFNDKNIFVCGHPHFDFVQEWGKLNGNKLKPEGKKRILFVSEGSARTYEGSRSVQRDFFTSFHAGRTEAALEIFFQVIRPHRANFLLRFRPHPKDELDDFSHFIPFFDEVDKNPSSLDSILESELVIGTTSMVISEAAILGVPTICIIMSEEEKNWLPSIRGGATLTARSEEELVKCLEDKDKSKATNWNIKFGAQEAIGVALESILAR